jgi:signal transduction histidine kinase
VNTNNHSAESSVSSKRSPLARTLLVIVLTVYLGVLVILTSIELTMQLLTNRQTMRQEIVSTIEALTPVIDQQMWFLDLAGLENTATALLSDSNVYSVEFNSSVADIRIQKGTLPLSPLIRKSSGTVTDTRPIELLQVQTADSLQLIEFQFPVIFDNQEIGHGSVYAYEPTIYDAFRTSFPSSFISTLTQLFVLSVVFYLVVLRLVTRPISFLSETLRQPILNSDTQRQASEKLALRKDELGELFKNYLALTAELKNKDKEVHDYQNELEHRVQKRTQELQLALEQLEKNQQQRQDFLAYMSHEIRNPINAIVGLTEMLRDTGIRKEQESLIRTMVNSGQSLLNIINDILDLTKLEAGKVVLEQIEFNLRDVVDDCMLLVSSSAINKNIFLGVYVQADLPGTVKGDPTRLRQILTNLLTNAIKFTDKRE